MDTSREPAPPATSGASAASGRPGAPPAAPAPRPDAPADPHPPAARGPQPLGLGGWIPLLGAAIPIAVFAIGWLEHRLAPPAALPTPATIPAPAPAAPPPAAEPQRTGTDFLPQPTARGAMPSVHPPMAVAGG